MRISSLSFCEKNLIKFANKLLPIKSRAKRLIEHILYIYVSLSTSHEVDYLGNSNNFFAKDKGSMHPIYYKKLYLFYQFSQYGTGSENLFRYIFILQTKIWKIRAQIKCIHLS